MTKKPSVYCNDRIGECFTKNLTGAGETLGEQMKRSASTEPKKKTFAIVRYS
jgi:hypothetical protein